jgi:hypothetical protein
MEASTPAQRTRATLDLTALAEQLLRARLRRTHPDFTETDNEEAVHRWYTVRPGAEFGDLPGPVSARRL